MAELKTKETDGSVEDFLGRVPQEKTREECRALVRLMKRVTGEEPKMWGASIIGFGSYHYRYESGRKGEWFLTGFSPRKKDLTLYIMAGFDQYDDLMSRLGKHKTGKSCLYIRSIDDIDQGVLEKLVRASVAATKKTYGA